MAGVRRTWDKDNYEIKAKRRAELGDDGVEDTSLEKGKKLPRASLKEEFIPASENSSGPMGSERAFLKAREHRIDLDSKVGKTQIVTPSEVEGAAAPGWWCEVCKCLLKDSTSYLDHINGKKHQRALGYSMRVERAGVSQVKERLSMLKRKVAEDSLQPRLSVQEKAAKTVEDYEARISMQIAEVDTMKRRRREEGLARQEEKRIVELETADPEIAALMGFSGFGGGKKTS